MLLLLKSSVMQYMGKPRVAMSVYCTGIWSRFFYLRIVIEKERGNMEKQRYQKQIKKSML